MLCEIITKVNRQSRLAELRVATQCTERDVMSVIYKEFLQIKKEINNSAENCARK